MAKTSPKQTAKQQAANTFDELFGTRQGERILSGSFKMLGHDRITVRPQVRRTFPKGDMEELRGSIRELRAQKSGIEGTGLLQALLVCPAGDGYRLIAGEKRFRATQAEGLPEIPCVVVPAVSEGMTRLLQLTENAQRTPPAVLDEAEAIRETMEEQKLSLRDMARLMGKTLGYVTNRLSLLKTAPDVRAMIGRRADTIKHAPLIEAVQDPAERAELIRAVVEEEISVRELERRLRSAMEERSADFASATKTLDSESSAGDEPPSEASRDGEVFSRENSDGLKSLPAGTGKLRHGALNFQSEGAAHGDVHGHDQRHEEATLPDPNPIITALQPARSLVAEAERMLQGRSLSPDYKAEVLRHVVDLEKHLARLKKAVE